MTSERKLNVSLSMKIKGESTSVKVLPWDPFATFNVVVLIHSFVHIGCAFVVIEGFVNEINNKLCVARKARTLRIKK
jgi:hypothetical protein